MKKPIRELDETFSVENPKTESRPPILTDGAEKLDLLSTTTFRVFCNCSKTMTMLNHRQSPTATAMSFICNECDLQSHIVFEVKT